MMNARLKREISCFILAGIIATFTDFVIYWSLHFYFYYSTAKTISFISGSVVAYFLNKFFTFKQHERSVSEAISFTLLYAFSLVVNVAINSFCIFILPMFLPVPAQIILVLAFLMATGVSTIISFLGQRFWVFKPIKG